METTEIIEQPVVQEAQPLDTGGMEGTTLLPSAYETKPVEAPAETSQETPSATEAPEPDKTKETTPVIPESVVSPAETAVPALDPEKWLQEQTNGKIAKADDLKAILERDPLSELPEDERQLIAIKRSGIEPMEYLRIQSTDFKGMDAESILKYDFLNLPENKGLSEDLKEIAYEDFRNSRFPNLDAVDENDPRARLDRYKLETQAEAVRAKWVGEQEKMRIVPASTGQTGGLSKEDQDALAAKHLANVEQVLGNSTKTYEVKSGEDTVSLSLKTDAIKDQLKNNLIDPTKNFLLPRWSNPDGSLNVAQMEEDQTKILLWDEAIKSAYEKGVSKRETTVMRTLENPAPASTVAASNTEASAEGFAAAFSNAFSPVTNRVDY